MSTIEDSCSETRAVFIDKLEQLKKHYHPLLKEQPFLYLPADVCYLECYERILIGELSLIHRLELFLIKIKVVLVELEILFLKLLVKVSAEVTAENLFAS